MILFIIIILKKVIEKFKGTNTVFGYNNPKEKFAVYWF